MTGQSVALCTLSFEAACRSEERPGGSVTERNSGQAGAGWTGRKNERENTMSRFDMHEMYAFKDTRDVRGTALDEQTLSDTTPLDWTGSGATPGRHSNGACKHGLLSRHRRRWTVVTLLGLAALGATTMARAEVLLSSDSGYESDVSGNCCRSHYFVGDFSVYS